MEERSQCERCEIIEEGAEIRYPDMSRRMYNQPWKHGLDEERPMIGTGQIYTPS